MNKYYLFLIIPIFFSCKKPVKDGQWKVYPPLSAEVETAKKELTVAFYNVENLFDTENNPDKIDEDFLPDGRFEWDEKKYNRKLFQLAKAIKSIGPNGPDLLGLGEVENAKVVEDLLQQEALKGRKYKFVHEESPDMRGIDVAFVYDPKVFKLSEHQAYEIYFKQEPSYTSRKVLCVSGKINKESLYLLINHWPSRRGGQEESEFRRLAVAEEVNEVLEEIYAKDDDANILIMGDLNDDPLNNSIHKTLGAVAKVGEVQTGTSLFNPMAELHNTDSYGSLTYRGKWNLFDQIIMNSYLLDFEGKLRYVPNSASVHNIEMLQVGFGRGKDNPRRAIFRGKFDGEGYSDHFPVYVKLKVK